MDHNTHGRLIVIDGLDGSGKSTQFDRLLGILSPKLSVKGISFPDYDMPSATLVKMYLRGDFSKNAADVNAYAASTFYAADRYASYKLCWEKNYLNGDLILASRYVCSNAIHQMSKLPENEWDGFLEWLEDYEYDKLGLPRPDRTIILDIPVELSQQRLSERYDRLHRVRRVSNRIAEDTRTPAEMIIKPQILRNLCWVEDPVEADGETFLIEQGARNWQVKLIAPSVSGVIM